MNIPQLCPICNKLLVNVRVDLTGINNSYLRKECYEYKSDHSIYYYSLINDYYTVENFMFYGNHLRVGFFPISKEIIIFKSSDGYHDSIKIPYFDPDFSSLKKFLEKINLYIVFI